MKLFQSWEKTTEFLLKAKSFISIDSFDESQIQILQWFDEYIEHNELGLAYDQLTHLSETVSFPEAFWTEMLLAAEEMKLEDEIKKCESFLKQ